MTVFGHIGLAREIHDRVVQRLCGVSFVLASMDELDAETRERCSRELGAALGELRALLSSALPAEPQCTFGELVRAVGLRHRELPLEIEMAPQLEDVAAPAAARHFVEESLRNVVRHAHPRRVVLAVESGEISVYNDGVLPAIASAGIGLELLRAEAADCGAAFASGPEGDSGWRATLWLPLSRSAPAAAHA